MDEKKNHDDDLEFFAEGITSKDAPVALWLRLSYVFWFLVGLTCMILYWNGSWGWLDRGYWNELQRAANTKFPFTTTEIVEKEDSK